MTQEEILNHLIKTEQTPFENSLTVPAVIKFPKLQKINFDSIKTAAEFILNLQEKELKEYELNGSSKRIKKNSKIFLIIAISVIILLFSVIDSKGFGAIFLLFVLFFGGIFIFAGLKSILMKQKTMNLEDIELMIYKNYCHITNLENIGREFEPISSLRSNSSSNDEFDEEFIERAYKMKADAIIGMNVEHTTSSNTRDHFNGIGAQRYTTTEVNHHYSATGTAIKLI
jgi:hypothetical protein